MTLSLTTQQKSTALNKMLEVGLRKEQAAKEISFAAQLVARDPNLQKCQATSVMAAIVNVANIGLTLNPAAKEAYLITRYNRKTSQHEATLEPSYIGLQNLAMRTGAIKSLVTQIVHKNDKIEINLADNDKPVNHMPELIKSKRGEMIGVYALATLPDGSRQVEWMDKEEINTIRDYSDSYKAFIGGKIRSCVWSEHYGEMARKTVVKRILKYLPKGSQSEQLNKAIDIDNQDYKAEFWQLEKLDGLMKDANVDDELYKRIWSDMGHGMTFHEANEWIAKLNDMLPPQHDPRYVGVTSQKNVGKAVADKVADPKA